MIANTHIVVLCTNVATLHVHAQSVSGLYQLGLISYTGVTGRWCYLMHKMHATECSDDRS